MHGVPRDDSRCVASHVDASGQCDRGNGHWVGCLQVVSHEDHDKAVIVCAVERVRCVLRWGVSHIDVLIIAMDGKSDHDRATLCLVDQCLGSASAISRTSSRADNVQQGSIVRSMGGPEVGFVVEVGNV